LLDRYGEPEVVFNETSVLLNGLSSAQQELMASLEIGDILAVEKRFAVGTPSVVRQNVVVESIRHQIAPSRHEVFLGLGQVQLVSPFIVGGYTTTTTRTNLVPNPSFEVNTTGWVNIQTGTTNTRITTDSYSGLACTQVNITGLVANSGISTSFTSGERMPVTAGIPYMWSVYVKVPAGQPSVSLRLRTSEYRADGTQNTAQVSASTTVTDADGWVRLSFADTPTGGATPTVSMSNRVEVGSTVGSARTWLVDAALFEQASSALPYFDGTYADTYTGYTLTEQAWNGTANASTSTATWGLTSSFVGSPLDDEDFAVA
jgi:hypothetical protein